MTALFDNLDTDAEDSLVGHEFDTGFDARGAVVATLALSQFYSHPQEAVLREYIANAADATAGRDTAPTLVRLPSYDQPVVEIRDFGPGMSLDTLSRKFFNFGGSDKTADDIGAFGFGSKSGYAVSTGWSLTNIHGGRRITVSCTQDATGKRVQRVVGDEQVSHDPSDPDTHSGVRVVLPLSSDLDMDRWIGAAVNVMQFMPADRFDVRLQDRDEPLDVPAVESTTVDGITFVDGVSWSKARVKVNNVLYRVDPDALRQIADEVVAARRDDQSTRYGDLISAALSRVCERQVVMSATESQVSIAPTRESLIIDSTTSDFLRRTLEAHVAGLVRALDDANTAETLFAKVLRIREMREVYPRGKDQSWADALNIDLDQPIGFRRRASKELAKRRCSSFASESKIYETMAVMSDVRVRDVFAPTGAVIVTGVAASSPVSGRSAEEALRTELWWTARTSALTSCGDVTTLLSGGSTIPGQGVVAPYNAYKTWVRESVRSATASSPRSMSVKVHTYVASDTDPAVLHCHYSEYVPLRELNDYLDSFSDEMPKVMTKYRSADRQTGVPHVRVFHDRRKPETVRKAAGSVDLLDDHAYDVLAADAANTAADAAWNALTDRERHVLTVRHVPGADTLEWFMRTQGEAALIPQDCAARQMVADYREGQELFARIESVHARNNLDAACKRAALDSGYEPPVLLTMMNLRYGAASQQVREHVVRYVSILRRVGGQP